MSHGGSAEGKILHRARSYDLLVWILTLGRERRFRDHLVGLARLAPGESVLDVGCGTGSLALAAKARVGAGGEVCGVDPSAAMVTRARRKATRAAVDARFEAAPAEALPFGDDSFDAVLSSLVLHHLTQEARPRAFEEIARVLRPGGRFLAVDLGGQADGHDHGKRHGLHRWRHRHADYSLDELAPTLEEVGFEIAERGPVGGPRLMGVGDLRFLLAIPPSS